MENSPVHSRSRESAPRVSAERTAEATWLALLAAAAAMGAMNAVSAWERLLLAPVAVAMVCGAIALTITVLHVGQSRHLPSPAPVPTWTRRPRKS